MCACDTVIQELNFTPCAFAIVRQRGTVDGQQGEDRLRNFPQTKKVVTADRGREIVFIRSNASDGKGRGQGRTGVQSETEQENREGYTISRKSNMNCDRALSVVRS